MIKRWQKQSVLSTSTRSKFCSGFLLQSFFRLIVNPIFNESAPLQSFSWLFSASSGGSSDRFSLAETKGNLRKLSLINSPGRTKSGMRWTLWLATRIGSSMATMIPCLSVWLRQNGCFGWDTLVFCFYRLLLRSFQTCF